MARGRTKMQFESGVILALALFAATALLPACGGGGGGGIGTPALPQPPPRQFPGPGTNSGMVQGKSSTIVNAVEFHAAPTPTITIDGVSSTQDQILEGMQVTMRGSYGPLDPEGTFTTLEAEPQLIGRVDAVNAGAGTFTVLGQTVRVTNFTIFETTPGGGRIGDLAVGVDVAHVYGFFLDFGAPHVIEATLVREVGASTTKRQIRGVVAGVPTTGTFTIGGQAVINNTLTTPAVDNFVEVEGTGGDAGAAVTATPPSGGVRIISSFGALANDEIEIEGSVESHDNVAKSFVLRTPAGRVTARYDVPGFFTPTAFEFEEDISASPNRTPAQVLALNAQVEVEGKLVGGILQAREIELKRLENVLLVGDVTNLQPGVSFVLQPFNLTVSLAGAIITTALPSLQLSNGAHVEVGGNVIPPGTSLSQVAVTRVTVLPASANRRLQGPVSAHGSGVDGNTDTITILGILVDTTGLQDRDDPVLGIPSEFTNAANFRIDKTKFFGLLRNNITVVRAKGARDAQTGAEPFSTGAFNPNAGVEIEEHR